MIAKLLSPFLLLVIWGAFPAAAAGEAGAPRIDSPAGRADVFPPVRRVERDFTWNVSAALPAFDHPVIDGEIRAWLNRLLAAALEEEDGGFPPEESATLSIWIDYRLSRPSDHVLSVAIETSWYREGNAHPASSIDIVNFSYPDARILRLDSLFSDPEKALAIFSALSPGLILESLRKENPEVLANSSDPDDIWLNRDGFAPTRENYSSLGLEPGGVRIHFGEYQVLAYAFGKPEVLIPLSALAPAGPNPDVWPAGAAAAP